MSNNQSIQILRVDSEERFNQLFQQQGLGSLSALDGQPLYVKDKARLYVGNDSFSADVSPGVNKKLFMPVVAPYKHTIRLTLQGHGDNRLVKDDFINGPVVLQYLQWALVKYLRVDATLIFTSFKKEPISAKYESNNASKFYDALNNLGREQKLTDKMFLVSASGIAHTGVAIGTQTGVSDNNKWRFYPSGEDPKLQGIVGPIVGFEPWGSGNKIVMLHAAKYDTSLPENQPPSSLVGPTSTVSYSLGVVQFNNPTPNISYTFLDSCGDEIKSSTSGPMSILPGTTVGVNINFSNSNGQGTTMDAGVIEDTVTDNY